MSYAWRSFHNVDAAIVKDLPPYDFKLKQGLCKRLLEEDLSARGGCDNEIAEIFWCFIMQYFKSNKENFK